MDWFCLYHSKIISAALDQSYPNVSKASPKCLCMDKNRRHYHNKMKHNKIVCMYCKFIRVTSHERHGVSNYRQIGCLFSSLFRLTTEKAPRLHITGCDRWKSLAKGQLYVKRFNVIMVSCQSRTLWERLRQYVRYVSPTKLHGSMSSHVQGMLGIGDPHDMMDLCANLTSGKRRDLGSVSDTHAAHVWYLGNVYLTIFRIKLW